MVKSRLWLGFILLIAIGLVYALTAVQRKADIRSALLDGTYTFEGDQVITLKDGKAQGPLSPRFSDTLYDTQIIGSYFSFDLDNDGDLDALSYFTRKEVNSAYGPGYYIAGVINTKDGFKGTNAVFLGDLIDPGAFEPVEGFVAAHYVGHFPDPNMTPPTLPGTVYLKLVNGELANASDEYRDAHPPAPITDTDEAPVRAKAKAVLAALKNKDVNAFKVLVHPTEGVRFGNYGQVNNGSVVLTPAQIDQHVASNDTIVWGISDGKGDPIEHTVRQHLSGLYKYDYLNAPTASYKRVIRGGSAGNSNVEEFYAGKPFISFHFPFTSSYTGDNGEVVNNELSWQTLDLIFDRYNGEWYLIGIIPDNWTI